MKISKTLTTFSLILLFSATLVSASGYGTSIITLSNNNVNLFLGSSAAVNYTVNLASGNTWGTTLVVANQNELTANGINVALSNPSGDPPFSGVLTISTTNASIGSYNIVLTAVGDDPSVNNATLYANVQYNINVPKNQSNQTNATTVQNTSSNTPQTTAAQSPPNTQQIYYTTSTSGNENALYGGRLIGLEPIVIFLTIIIIIITALSVKHYQSAISKFIIVGTALIFLGILAWLYGDYAGLLQYIWGGVALIIIGVAVWLYGNHKAGSFHQTPAKLVAGVALIIMGTLIWIYGDYNNGLISYIWGGAALIIIGVVVWLYNDVKHGAFSIKKTKR